MKVVNIHYQNINTRKKWLQIHTHYLSCAWIQAQNNIKKQMCLHCKRLFTGFFCRVGTFYQFPCFAYGFLVFSFRGVRFCLGNICERFARRELCKRLFTGFLPCRDLLPVSLFCIRFPGFLVPRCALLFGEYL